MIASAKSDYEKVGDKQPDGITGKADPHTDTRDGTSGWKPVKDGVAGVIHNCLGLRLPQTEYQSLLKGTSPKRYVPVKDRQERCSPSGGCYHPSRKGK